MARSAGSLWPLEYHLPTNEPLSQERRHVPRIREVEGSDGDPPEALSIDSPSIKVHTDGTGALKNSPQSLGKFRGVWNTKIPMFAARDRQAVKFSLSPGQAPDAPEGRKLWRRLETQTAKVSLLMDKAYEGRENREQAQAMGMDPVVPPLKSCLHPWKYNKELYQKRNEVERLSSSLLPLEQTGHNLYGDHRVHPYL